MYKWLVFGVLLSASFVSGCSFSRETVARVGTAGSTTGYHSIKLMYIEDTQDGGASFAHGAVSSYSGASADIGSIGIPKHIDGYWAKYHADEDELIAFYRISTLIDSNLAKQKIETLRNYYKNHRTLNTRIRVVVDSERVRVLYSMNCYSYRMDCTPKENADPNGWVVRSPDNTTEVVVLFDGTGEASDTPFPGSPYDK
ncbi:hypothetical protein [Photobacterium halotolerans]|uniref:Lipoprotein n=1 Tax=Photobacterium halotolerans TaxID=265726 RepID=A0A0F5VA74_9GAMM|nr:hypothetical protein [Photobacterium halotolerans]KKC99050.1 hypothetical protein KY46_14460 [Photobacterium halotolerans]